MITRIKIDGFKSLLETDLYLGPFTCIAGENAVGKSNFFDALQFLSKLADNTIIQAAKSIRSENQKHSDIKDIFFKTGSAYYDTMKFEIDMLVPTQAIDDLGQEAAATSTSLRYALSLKMNNEPGFEPIQILEESLILIAKVETTKNIFFTKNTKWIDSAIHQKNKGKTTAFISTQEGKIKLHQDGKQGRTADFIAFKMPRTLLSSVTSESPTAFIARQEMRNWAMLQFDPHSLRQPNNIYEVKNAEIQSTGGNLPATLYRLQSEKKDGDVFQRITNELKNLVPDVDEIMVEKDDKRDLLTLQIKFKDGLVLPAQSLSDGTLRFLGLIILNEDTKSSGVICLEEPENGIHPEKINDMVTLLEDMATDTEYAVGIDNPLSQVIINTHSPIVVSAVRAESLLLASEKEIFSERFNKKIHCTNFSALPNTWKAENKLISITTRGEMLSYLDRSPANEQSKQSLNQTKVSKQKRTVSQNMHNQASLFDSIEI